MRSQPDPTPDAPPVGDPRPDDPRPGDDGLVRPLGDTLASKIAAGEVVQRPANALKELLENALDAGASRVDVVLRRAGSELIQVTDDGCGMGPRDALAAFGRHATSKLRAFEDLERLRTLGFRGEALASIASVSRVELRTRRRQDAAATVVRADGGEPAAAPPAAAAEGTCVSVRQLFFNVPARRAFLKTPATEFKHLVETFQAVAMSHPGVAFSLTHDDTEVYRLAPAAALAERVVALLGAEHDGRLVAVGERTSYLSVSGVVGRPEASRRGRGEQYLFVNGRTVRSRALDAAVRQAYGALVPEGHHPLSVLFLDVDPRHVDVNVHPTKTEVVFDDDRGVYSFVRAVVKKGLAEAGLALALPEMPGRAAVMGPTVAGFAALPPRPDEDVPAFAPSGFPSGFPPGDVAAGWPLPAWPDARSGDGESDAHEAGPTPDAPRADTPRADAPRADGPRASVPAGFSATPATWHAPRGPVPSAASALPGGAPEADGLGVPPDAALWALHGRYLLAPVRSGLLVIDQRAAHERILYERALAAMDSGLAPRQQLLFPFTVELNPADRALLADLRPDLAALGFDLADAPGGAVLVRGLPADVTLGDERTVLDDLLAQVRLSPDRLRLGARETLARSHARRTAIRPGHALRPAEARALVDQLFACAEPFSDPAGRPTLFRLSDEEIDRRFGR